MGSFYSKTHTLYIFCTNDKLFGYKDKGIVLTLNEPRLAAFITILWILSGEHDPIYEFDIKVDGESVTNGINQYTDKYVIDPYFTMNDDGRRRDAFRLKGSPYPYYYIENDEFKAGLFQARDMFHLDLREGTTDVCMTDEPVDRQWVIVE